jgi:hypothetical protein
MMPASYIKRLAKVNAAFALNVSIEEKRMCDIMGATSLPGPPSAVRAHGRAPIRPDRPETSICPDRHRKGRKKGNSFNHYHLYRIPENRS